MPNISCITNTTPTSHADILASIQQFDKHLLMTSERSRLEAAVASYITSDPTTRDMLSQARVLSSRNEPVLILGETGTGKELVANILNARRFSEVGKTSTSAGLPIPITPINCAGLTETLFESLVFGHKRGSFTGAIGDEPGLLRSASKGTAFFDEVGELPLAQQSKLLRVLQTSRVRPVGDTEEYAIECRFVFATHRNLKTMVQQGLFRGDLFYRISKFVLHTSPLHSRPCDIPLLIKHIYQREGWTLDGLVHPPVDAYAQGNVRQLENYLFRKEVLNLTDEEALVDL